MIPGEGYNPAERFYIELPDILVLLVAWVHLSANFLMSGFLYLGKLFSNQSPD